MSGSGFYNYYPAEPAEAYIQQESARRSWSWRQQQQQPQHHYGAGPVEYTRSPGSIYSRESQSLLSTARLNGIYNRSQSTSAAQSSSYSRLRSQQYHGSSSSSLANRGYQPRRYSDYENDRSTQNDYGTHQQQNRHRPQNQKYKRKNSESLENPEPKKVTKKKKKPMSQMILAKKEWTLEEAEMALKVERELDKSSNPSLVIRFPDLELNEQIVMKLHPAIETVKIQQSKPRFCFVSLKETADTDGVISDLSKTKFGDGYLAAEYKKPEKKDAEDCHNIGPEAINPTQLYVGNLPQNVTIDDIVRVFPKARRRDMGFSLKSKNTRYAFIVFCSAADAIEALKANHNSILHYISMKVRFVRLSGVISRMAAKQNTPCETATENRTNETNENATTEVSAAQPESADETCDSYPEPETPCSFSNESSDGFPLYSGIYEYTNGLVSSSYLKNEILPEQYTDSVGDLFEKHGVKLVNDGMPIETLESEKMAALEKKEDMPDVKTDVENEASEVSKCDAVVKDDIDDEHDIPVIKTEPIDPSEQIFDIEQPVKQEPDPECEDTDDLEDEQALGIKDFESFYNSMKNTA